MLSFWQTITANGSNPSNRSGNSTLSNPKRPSDVGPAASGTLPGVGSDFASYRSNNTEREDESLMDEMADSLLTQFPPYGSNNNYSHHHNHGPMNAEFGSAEHVSATAPNPNNHTGHNVENEDHVHAYLGEQQQQRAALERVHQSGGAGGISGTIYEDEETHPSRGGSASRSSAPRHGRKCSSGDRNANSPPPHSPGSAANNDKCPAFSSTAASTYTNLLAMWDRDEVDLWRNGRSKETNSDSGPQKESLELYRKFQQRRGSNNSQGHGFLNPAQRHSRQEWVVRGGSVLSSSTGNANAPPVRQPNPQPAAKPAARMQDREDDPQDKTDTSPPPGNKQRQRQVNEKQHWMPDELCKHCYACETPFTVFRRRHHCRLCGQVFCSNCSAYFVELDFGIGKDEEGCDGEEGAQDDTDSSATTNTGRTMRACKMCYEQVIKEDEREKGEPNVSNNSRSISFTDTVKEEEGTGLRNISSHLSDNPIIDDEASIISNISHQMAGDTYDGSNFPVTAELYKTMGKKHADDKQQQASLSNHPLKLTHPPPPGGRLGRRLMHVKEHFRAQRQNQQEQQKNHDTNSNTIKSKKSDVSSDTAKDSPAFARLMASLQQENTPSPSTNSNQTPTVIYKSTPSPPQTSPATIMATNSKKSNSSPITQQTPETSTDETSDTSFKSASRFLGAVAAQHLEKMGRELLLSDAPLIPSAANSAWCDTLMMLATRTCATVQPNVKAGDLLDIRP